MSRKDCTVSKETVVYRKDCRITKETVVSRKHCRITKDTVMSRKTVSSPAPHCKPSLCPVFAAIYKCLLCADSPRAISPGWIQMVARKNSTQDGLPSLWASAQWLLLNGKNINSNLCPVESSVEKWIVLSRCRMILIVMTRDFRLNGSILDVPISS